MAHAIIARMDIRAGVIVLSIFAVFAAYSLIRASLRVVRTARRLSFYSLRRQQYMGALRLFVFALLLLAAAYGLLIYGETAIYMYFPPSPTPTITPSITLTPTITKTPTITITPSQTSTPLVSNTPTFTPTPFLPVSIEALFIGLVTPNPEAVFTAIQFSTQIDKREAVAPRTVFELPIKTMYGAFDYNNTIPGVQWSALWYRDRELVCFETLPWDGGTGGAQGLTECVNPIGGWQPGPYEVQLFMGYDWKVVSRFHILGPAVSATPTVTKVIPMSATITVSP